MLTQETTPTRRAINYPAKRRSSEEVAELMAEVEKLCAEGSTLCQAAEKVGVSRQAVYTYRSNHRRADGTVSPKTKNPKARPNALAESAAQSRMIEDLTALFRKMPYRTMSPKDLAVMVATFATLNK